jgi:hypothetical protein
LILEKNKDEINYLFNEHTRIEKHYLDRRRDDEEYYAK